MYDQHLRAVALGADGGVGRQAGGDVDLVRGLVVDRDGGGFVRGVQHGRVIFRRGGDIGALRGRLVVGLAARGRGGARRIDLGGAGRQPELERDRARNEVPVFRQTAHRLLRPLLAAHAREHQQRAGQAQRDSGGQPNAAPPPVVLLSAPSHGRHLPVFASIIRPAARGYDRILTTGASGQIQVDVLDRQVRMQRHIDA